MADDARCAATLDSAETPNELGNDDDRDFDDASPPYAPTRSNHLAIDATQNNYCEPIKNQLRPEWPTETMRLGRRDERHRSVHDERAGELIPGDEVDCAGHLFVPLRHLPDGRLPRPLLP